MPSAPAIFSVKFDLTGTPKLVLTDTGGWTLLEKPNVRGYFDITPPDGVTRFANFSSPDIQWNGSALPAFEWTLRLNTEGTPQCGIYTIKYYTEHPDYTIGSLQRIFTFQYTEKTLDIEKDFDVFTPSLFYRDNTSYGITGYNITSNTVAWSSVITGVGTVTGSANNFDLIYASAYHAGTYNTSFQRDVLYTSQAYSWLTIADRYSKTYTDTIYQPLTIGQMLACLNALWDDYSASGCGCSGIGLKTRDKFEYAASLYTLILEKLRSGSYEGLTDIIAKFQTLTSCNNGDGAGVLEPYDPEAALKPPNDITFTVAASGSYIIAGQQTKTVTSHIGWRLRVKRNKFAEMDYNDTSGTYYEWNTTTGLLELFGALTIGETIRIEGY